MKLSPPRSARARPGRCYVPAPPLTRRGNGAEGADILQELPGDLGVLLWATLRDVMLYLGGPAAERGALFPAGAGEARRAEIAACGVDPALWAPLLVVAEMMEGPAEASRARVAHACRALARWAEGDAPATRLAFSQAAALARPGDPRLALATARLARDAADHARAETWFRRAVKLARGKDWESYIRAFLGLGIMYYRGGNYPAAGVVAGRALRAARRRRLREMEGEAHHDLMLIAGEGNRPALVYQHARAALEAFGPQHRRLPFLAHDVACAWCDEGRFDLALPVFERLLPSFPNPAERVRVLANATRAAGGAGARAQYEEYRASVIALLRETPGAAPSEAELMLLVARADNSMGEWRRAEEAALQSIERATARGENQNRLLAEAQHQIALTRQAGAASSARRDTVREQAERLAGELTRTLELRVPSAAGAGA
jgi:tetratricopeptide (TPR) repeat protein